MPHPHENGWMTIESAPKDGSRVQLLAVKLERMKLLPGILWIKVGNWRAHYADGYESAWREDAVASPIDTSLARLAPTHWQPLPAPPVALITAPDLYSEDLW